MKKTYSKPELRSVPLNLGVFGSYNDVPGGDIGDGGCGGGGGGGGGGWWGGGGGGWWGGWW